MTFALDGKFLTSDYDDDADVLYLWVESPCPAVTYETSQGHLVQLDPETRVLEEEQAFQKSEARRIQLVQVRHRLASINPICGFGFAGHLQARVPLRVAAASGIGEVAQQLNEAKTVIWL